MDLDFARPAAARVASAIEGRCGIEAPCVGVDMSKPPSSSEIGVEFAFGQDGELKIRSCIGVDGTKRPSPADLEVKNKADTATVKVKMEEHKANLDQLQGLQQAVVNAQNQHLPFCLLQLRSLCRVATCRLSFGPTAATTLSTGRTNGYK